MKTRKLCRVFDHQNKSAAYKQALADAGYIFTDRLLVNGLRFVLTDADWREHMMLDAAELHTPVFLYPHAARPMVQYDGCVAPQLVRCMFTHAEGGREIMRKIGYPYPVEVVGWSYSDIRPFRPVADVKRVLFAPIHPNANGWLSEIDKQLNMETFSRLLKWCGEHGADLSVRYIMDPERCGLGEAVQTHAPFVEWHAGKKNNSTADLQSADVVVSHQTFAYLAVALGVPTVMMGEDIPPRSGNSDESFRIVEHWDDYKADLMFPLDILAGDPDETIRKACAGCPDVEAWKTRFIGKPFNGPAFVERLESYL